MENCFLQNNKTLCIAFPRNYFVWVLYKIFLYFFIVEFSSRDDNTDLIYCENYILYVSSKFSSSIKRLVPGVL